MTSTRSASRVIDFFRVCLQAVGRAAEGVEAHRPIRARPPGGQVLADGSHHGNAEKGQSVSAGPAHTGAR